MTSRWVLKAGALAAPFAVLYAVLALFGPSLSQGISRLFSPRGYEVLERGPYVLHARKGSGNHDLAARTLDEFTDPMMSKFGSAFGFHRPERGTSPLTIYLLESREELKKFGLTRFNSDLANNGGYFDWAKLEIAFVLTGRRGDDERVLRHEMTHALMHLSHRDRVWPSWLAEGMASYFEHSRVVEGVWRPGGTPEDRPRNRPSLALARVLSAQDSDFSGAANADFYDSAHLLVAYLLEKESRKFQEYYGAVHQGTGAGSFERFFDLAATEAAWHRWVRELKQSLTRRPAAAE